VKSTKFKVIPFDHGLYQRMIGITPTEIFEQDFDPVNKGSLAEVYVGCALTASNTTNGRDNLYYWHRESKSSNAEVDYVIQVDQRIIPIEVKSGTKGSMQSMRLFLSEKKNHKFGIQISLENFSIHDNILTVPLYAVSQISRIVREQP
jgi:predicted AAA+ superfamily ATPase